MLRLLASEHCFALLCLVLLEALGARAELGVVALDGLAGIRLGLLMRLLERLAVSGLGDLLSELRRPVERANEALEQAKQEMAACEAEMEDARAAVERGDANAERKIRDAQARLASADFSLEMAKRYADEVRGIPHEGHHHEKVQRQWSEHRREDA